MPIILMYQSAWMSNKSHPSCWVIVAFLFRYQVILVRMTFE
jgi:hypothetical protein